MNLSLFIARRLYRGGGQHQRAGRLAAGIATVGVTMGLAIMLLSVSVLMGFKHELTEKMSGFAGDIQVMNSNAISSPESFPIATSDSLLNVLRMMDGVESVSRSCTKMGIVKTDDDFKGVMLKGVDTTDDMDFLRRYIVEGTLPTMGQEEGRNDIIISSTLARQLHLNIGDRLYAYFFEKNIRTRRFHIAGIYETNLDLIDAAAVVANLYTVRQLNNWEDDQSSYLEIKVTDPKKTDDIYERILSMTRTLIDHYGCTYATFTVQELYAQLFDWLKLLDLNVWVILALMISVASFTMVSGLLILILERTATIGILKTLGSTNTLIRRVFIEYAAIILLRGLILGNLLGIGIALLQKHFHIISLDPTKYYVSHVPVILDPRLFVIVNVGTVIVCLLALVGPSYVVARIRPVKAIRFD